MPQSLRRSGEARSCSGAGLPAVSQKSKLILCNLSGCGTVLLCVWCARGEYDEMYIRKKIYLSFRVRYLIISANKEETKVPAASCQFCVSHRRAPCARGALWGTGCGRPGEARSGARSSCTERVPGELPGGWSTPRAGAAAAWGTQGKEQVPLWPRPLSRQDFCLESLPRSQIHLRMWWMLSTSNP